jgi:hypothetical protein
VIEVDSVVISASRLNGRAALGKGASRNSPTNLAKVSSTFAGSSAVKNSMMNVSSQSGSQIGRRAICSRTRAHAAANQDSPVNPATEPGPRCPRSLFVDPRPASATGDTDRHRMRRGENAHTSPPALKPARQLRPTRDQQGRPRTHRPNRRRARRRATRRLSCLCVGSEPQRISKMADRISHLLFVADPRSGSCIRGAQTA